MNLIGLQNDYEKDFDQSNRILIKQAGSVKTFQQVYNENQKKYIVRETTTNSFNEFSLQQQVNCLILKVSHLKNVIPILKMYHWVENQDQNQIYKLITVLPLEDGKDLSKEIQQQNQQQNYDFQKAIHWFLQILKIMEDLNEQNILSCQIKDIYFINIKDQLKVCSGFFLNSISFNDLNVDEGFRQIQQVNDMRNVGLLFLQILQNSDDNQFARYKEKGFIFQSQDKRFIKNQIEQLEDQDIKDLLKQMIIFDKNLKITYGNCIQLLKQKINKSGQHFQSIYEESKDQFSILNSDFQEQQKNIFLQKKDWNIIGPLSAKHWNIQIIEHKINSERLVMKNFKIDENNFENFQYIFNEIQIMTLLENAQQQHPYVIKLKGFSFNFVENNPQDKYINLFYKYYPDKDLQDCMSQQDDENNQLFLSDNDKLKFLLKLAEGVKHLQQQNILHLGLSPDNILMEKKGKEYNPIINDFNMSKKLNIHNQSRKTTLSNQIDKYSPWEITQDKPLISTKADIWSFGCICFYIFTGEHPYKKSSPQNIQDQQQSKKTNFFLQATDVSLQKVKLIYDLLQKCLAIEISNRIDIVEVIQIIKSLIK